MIYSGIPGLLDQTIEPRFAFITGNWTEAIDEEVKTLVKLIAYVFPNARIASPLRTRLDSVLIKETMDCGLSPVVFSMQALDRQSSTWWGREDSARVCSWGAYCETGRPLKTMAEYAYSAVAIGTTGRAGDSLRSYLGDIQGAYATYKDSGGRAQDDLGSTCKLVMFLTGSSRRRLWDPVQPLPAVTTLA